MEEEAVVFERRSPAVAVVVAIAVVADVLETGARRRDAGASADDLEADDATDCGREVLSLIMDTGRAPIFVLGCSSTLLVPILLVPGARIDVDRAMPVFAPMLAGACILLLLLLLLLLPLPPPPIKAACAEARAAALLSGDGDRESSPSFSTSSSSSSCSASSLVVCSVLGGAPPNMVMGRWRCCGFGASSSADDGDTFRRPAAMVPGGNSRLRRLEASRLGSCDGIGSREGDSSMVGCSLLMLGDNADYLACAIAVSQAL